MISVAPPKRVLIVDDHRTILTIIAAGIRKLGDEYGDEYIVETANNGQEALKKIQALKNTYQEEYDLVITDYMMPNMNGIEVAKSVKKLSPKSQIVLMSAHNMATIKTKAKSLEVLGVLKKPISIFHIREIVQRVFEQPVTNSRESKQLKAKIGLAAQQSTLFEPLNSLRVNTNARCILLLSSSGHLVEVVGQTSDLDISSVSALVAANFMAAAELAKLVGNSSIFKSSYHEGVNYDIYAHDINGKFLLAIIFGLESKVGLVRHYANKTVALLPPLLTDDLFSVDFSDSDISETIQDDLDDLFGDNSNSYSLDKDDLFGDSSNSYSSDKMDKVLI